MSKKSQREAIISRLAELLRTERLRQGLSISEVAARSGLSRAMVSRVEGEERMPTIETLLRLSEALNVNLPELLSIAIRATSESEA